LGAGSDAADERRRREPFGPQLPGEPATPHTAESTRLSMSFSSPQSSAERMRAGTMWVSAPASAAATMASLSLCWAPVTSPSASMHAEVAASKAVSADASFSSATVRLPGRRSATEAGHRRVNSSSLTVARRQWPALVRAVSAVSNRRSRILARSATDLDGTPLLGIDSMQGPGCENISQMSSPPPDRYPEDDLLPTAHGYLDL